MNYNLDSSSEHWSIFGVSRQGSLYLVKAQFLMASQLKTGAKHKSCEWNNWYNCRAWQAAYYNYNTWKINRSTTLKQSRTDIKHSIRWGLKEPNLWYVDLETKIHDKEEASVQRQKSLKKI